MSNQIDVIINELLNNLKTTFISTNNNERNEAEKKVIQFENSANIEIIKYLINLIKNSNNNKIDNSLLISLVLMLNRIINKNLDLKKFSIEEKNDLLKEYFDVILIENLNNKLIENLSKGFESILYDLKDEKILILLTNYLGSNFNKINITSYKGLFTLLQIIITSNINEQILEILLNNIIEILKFIFDKLYNIYETLNYNNINDDFYKIIDLFSKIFDIINMGIFSLKKQYKKLQNNFLNKFSIFNKIALKLLISDKNNNNNNNNNLKIISFTENSEFDVAINTLKLKLIKFIINEIAGIDTFSTDNNIIESHGILMKTIIDDLNFVIVNKFDYLMKMDCKEKFSDNKYSILIGNLLTYFSKILGKEVFKNNFNKFEKEFFKEILLPLLLVTDGEIESSNDEEDYVEYVNFLEDVIVLNKTRFIKPASILLLKRLISNNKKFCDFVINYVCFMTVNVFNLSFENDVFFLEIVENFNNDKINVILNRFNDNKERKLDLCLLILTSFEEFLRNLTQKQKAIYENNLDFIQSLYEQIKKFILGDSQIPNFLRYKIILFVSTFAFEFYDPEEENFIEICDFLLSSFVNNNGKNIICEGSVKQLNEIIIKANKNLGEIFKKVFKKNIDVILKIIIETRFSNFFDFLYEIIVNFNCFDKDIEVIYLSFFEKLCQRVKMEIERHLRLKFKVVKSKKYFKSENKNNESNIIINKIFNIIRFLSEKEKFVAKNINSIEEIIFPLISYFENINKIDFDEDLIYVMSNLIKNLKTVPAKTGIQMLKYLNKYCEKNEGMILDLYELCNYYIIFGKDIFMNSENFKNFFDIFNFSLNDEKFLLSPFYSANLLQIFVLNYEDKIPREIIVNIIDLAIDKTNAMFEMSAKEKENFLERKFNFLGFLTLLYSTFINYLSFAFEELGKVGKIEFLVKWTKILVEFKIVNVFQFKLIVLSLDKVLESNVNNVFEFIDIGFELLELTRNEESKKLKKMNKKLMKFNFIKNDDSDDSDDDDENDNNFFNYNTEKEIQDLYDVTVCKYKDEDEFKSFRNSVNNFRCKNTDSFNNWFKQLSEKKKENFNNILNMKRIAISNDENNNIPRKILKIKRNLNNFN